MPDPTKPLFKGFSKQLKKAARNLFPKVLAFQQPPNMPRHFFAALKEAVKGKSRLYTADTFAAYVDVR